MRALPIGCDSLPGIVYRDGPTGRRAGLALGPDVWEVVSAIRHAPGAAETKLRAAAEQLTLPEEQVRLALDFAAEYADEVEARIALHDAAAHRARLLAERRARLMAS